MNAIHIHTQLNSTTVHLPEIQPLVGKRVEIIVMEEVSSPADRCDPGVPWVSPLAGSIVRDDDPFGPAVPPEQWEANR